MELSKPWERPSDLSVALSPVEMSQSGSSLCYFRFLALLNCLQNEATLALFFFFFCNEAEWKTHITLNLVIDLESADLGRAYNYQYFLCLQRSAAF